MRYSKFPGDLDSSIHIDLSRPDEMSAALEELSGHARKPDIVILRSSDLNRWHSEFINPHSWYELSTSAKPTPIVVFKNENEHLCGIVHMRNVDDQRSVCLSLANKSGAWQTGVWIEIEAGDKLSISWFRDWRHSEISAINLEIINAGHADPFGDEDDLIPLGDEVDLEFYAAEALLGTAPSDEGLSLPATGALEPVLSTVPATEPVTLPFDPGASIIICAAGEDENRLALNSNPWFNFQISNKPVPVANLITDQQRLAGKIYLRRLSEGFEYSLAVVSGNQEYSTGIWTPINPDSPLTLIWSTDRSGRMLEEFHIETAAGG